MCMRPELTVIPDHILRDALFRFVERCVTELGDPFRFQASEEARHWTVVPTVAAPTHALHHLIPPQLLPERQAGVLATLIGMVLFFFRFSVCLFCFRLRLLCLFVVC